MLKTDLEQMDDYELVHKSICCKHIVKEAKSLSKKSCALKLPALADHKMYWSGILTRGIGLTGQVLRE